MSARPDDSSRRPDEDETDWSAVPTAGFSAFEVARRAHLRRMEQDSEIFRLEEAWTADDPGESHASQPSDPA